MVQFKIKFQLCKSNALRRINIVANYCIFCLGIYTELNSVTQCNCSFDCQLYLGFDSTRSLSSCPRLCIGFKFLVQILHIIPYIGTIQWSDIIQVSLYHTLRIHILKNNAIIRTNSGDGGFQPINHSTGCPVAHRDFILINHKKIPRLNGYRAIFYGYTVILNTDIRAVLDNDYTILEFVHAVVVLRNCG